MGIHHSQATMSTPGLNSVGSCKSKHTFPGSNDVLLQQQGYAFIPLSKSPIQFLCVCTNPCLTSYIPPIPHRSALHGFQNKRKTNLLAKNRRLAKRSDDPGFGNFEAGFTRKPGLLLLIKS